MSSDHGTTAVSEEFTIGELGRVRALVSRAAKLVGLTRSVIDNLVVAVNEIAANAVRYAGGKGRIRIRSYDRGISVEISDSGPGLPAGLGDRPAGPTATGGRGLWMAHRLCPSMTVASSKRGVTVTLSAMRA
jgi:anti-sigma regulatory factor (Ser/Thr protein kinase)